MDTTYPWPKVCSILVGDQDHTCRFEDDASETLYRECYYRAYEPPSRPTLFALPFITAKTRLPANEIRAEKVHAGINKLPPEIFALVLDVVDRSDLNALAATNKRCWAAVRPRLWTDITFRYDERSTHLLELIEREFEGALDSLISSPGPTIASCVRHLTIATSRRALYKKHGNPPIGAQYRHTPINPKEQESIRAAVVVAEASYTSYLTLITHLLSTNAFINLERLDFHDRTLLSHNLMTAFSSTKIQELRLHRSIVQIDFRIELPDGKDHWPLEYLYLNLDGEYNQYYPPYAPTWPVEASPQLFFGSLLTSVARTLRVLILCSEHQGLIIELDDSTSTSLRFPCLQRVELQGLPQIDSYILMEALMPKDRSSRVRSLTLDPEYLIDETNFPGRSTTYPHLKHLIWNSTTVKSDSYIPFLEANTHLSSFLITQKQTPHEMIEERLLPLFISSFSNLTLLRLEIEGTEIRMEALEMMGQIISLRRLAVGIRPNSRPNSSWYDEWYADHEEIGQAFQGLVHLTHFILLGDTYPELTTCSSFYGPDNDDDEDDKVDSEGKPVRFVDWRPYLEEPSGLSDGETLNPGISRTISVVRHDYFMDPVAPYIAYYGDALLEDEPDPSEDVVAGANLPALEFIFLQHLPMIIKRDARGRSLVPLSKRRLMSIKFLRTMWNTVFEEAFT